MKKIYSLGISMLGLLCVTSFASAADNYEQIKIFQSCNYESTLEVEQKANEFLEKNRIHSDHIVDIKLSTTSTATSKTSSMCTTVMVIYHNR